MYFEKVFLVSLSMTGWIRASLIAQLLKNPPAMWESWVQSLGWEDPLGKGKATHLSILAWRIPWTIPSKELQTVGRDFQFHFILIFLSIDTTG